MPGSTHRRGLPRSPRAVIGHPLTWVLAIAVLVHAYALLGISVSLGYSDSNAYVLMAQGDPGMGISPPGYAFFLKVSHAVSSSVDLVLIMQHLAVIVGAIAVYDTAREAGTRRGTSVAAAGVFALCGNLLATAQGLLTETLFVALIAGAACGAVRHLSRDSIRALIAAGVCVGLAITVRTVGVPLLLFLAVAAFLTGNSLIDRLRRAGVLGGTAVATVTVLALLAGTSAGLPGAGKSAAGWLMYGRVATFADCPATYAPAAVRRLCPTTDDPAKRPGPDYWRVIGGPAFKTYKTIPNGDTELRTFAVSVIKHQPLDYARTVFVDTMRFFSPNFGQERPYAGAGWDELELDRPLDPAAAFYNRRTITSYFSSYRPRTHTLHAVARYQEATTLTPGVWLTLFGLAFLAPLLTRGRRRGVAAVLFLGALGLLVTATALNMYVARYALPTLGFLLPAAAIGFEALARRVTGVAEPESLGLEEETGDMQPVSHPAEDPTIAPTAPEGV